jgi:hypothetical protein
LSDIRPQYQSFEDSKESLKDGKIDAAFIVAGAPTSAITELATTNHVNIISIDGELFDFERITISCVRDALRFTVPRGVALPDYFAQSAQRESVTV